MLLVAVLVPFAAEFSYQVDMESQTALNVKEQLAIDNAIEGQYQIVLTRIEYDGIGNEFDSYNDAWNDEDMRNREQPEIEVRLATTMFDEAGKLPLAKLASGSTEEQAVWKQRLIDLLKLFRRDTQFDASNIAEELADEVVRFMRGENRGQTPKPKLQDDRAAVTLDDLHFASPLFAKHNLLVDLRDGTGVAPGLHRFLTVYGPGRVNLNTADLVLLQSIFTTEPTIAERIVERREGAAEEDSTRRPSAGEDDEEAMGNPFTDVNQINEIEGVNQQSLRANNVVLARDFDVRSHYFSMRIAGSTRNTHRQELFVVERVPGTDPNGPIEGFRHLLCQERTDALEEDTEEPR